MKPVNVMEVMDNDANEADFSRRRAGSPYAKTLRAESKEASFAVFDLLDKAAEALELLEAEDLGQYKSAQHLRAALARCKGEAK